MKKLIAVFTSTRAEYGLLRELCRKLDTDDSFELLLIVSGTHLDDEYGYTFNQIKKDGFSNFQLIDLDLGKNRNTSQISADLINKLSVCFETFNPEFLIVLGDRYEALGAVFSAYLKKIKIIHLHGGEETLGSLDNGFRNAISQLSFLHFTSADEHSKKLKEMGIKNENIFNSGPMILDLLNSHNPLNKEIFEKEINYKFGKLNVLLTFHPESFSNDYGIKKLKNLLNALIHLRANILITYPNIDEGGQNIKNLLVDFVMKNSHNAFLYTSLGTDLYLSSLKLFDIIVGNSSSGIIEAPLIGIPSLSIGDRQKGRKSFGKISYSNGSFDDICEKINILIDENRNSQFPRSLQIGGSSPSYEIIKRLKEIINL